MPTVPEIQADELPEAYRYLLTENAVGELSLFKTLANNPEILQSYMRWGTLLWEEAGLEAPEVELVILAVARQLRSKYEWHQHVRLAREVGLEDATIQAIAEENPERLAKRQQLLVAYATQFLDRTVDQQLADRISSTWNDGTVVGLTLLCSHYLATARTIEALDIQPEDEFVGWEIATDN